MAERAGAAPATGLVRRAGDGAEPNHGNIPRNDTNYNSAGIDRARVETRDGASVSACCGACRTCCAWTGKNPRGG